MAAVWRLEQGVPIAGAALASEFRAALSPAPAAPAPVSNPVLGSALNGWQITGLASFVSGAPLAVGFSTVTAMDITGSPTQGRSRGGDREPRAPEERAHLLAQFRTDVFRLPAVGTIGNSARTVLRGPGINNWDAAVFKTFPVREKVQVQFRWEAYDVFNHTQFSALDTGARFDARRATR